MDLITSADLLRKQQMMLYLTGLTKSEYEKDLKKFREMKSSERDVFRNNVILKKWAYGLPNPLMIRLVSHWINVHLKYDPSIKFCDVGAGSGLWLFLLHQEGVPKQNLVGFELNKSEVQNSFEKIHWPITFDSNAKIDPKDILFISWGYSLEKVVDDYVKAGGHCVIILGESKSSGLNSPAGDYFKDNPDWISNQIGVDPSFAYSGHDILSLNTRKVKHL